MKNRTAKIKVIALALSMASVLSAPALADDIEIYRPAEGKVNILIDLDMSGSMCFQVDGTIPTFDRKPCNWAVEPPLGPNTRGGILLSALDTIIDEADEDIHMGLTRFGWQGSTNSSDNPDYSAWGHGILLPVERLGDNSQDVYNDYVSDHGSVARADYLVNVDRNWKETMKALLAKDFKSRGATPIVDSLYETFLYFDGATPLRGKLNEPVNVWNSAQRGRPSHPLAVDPATGKYRSPKTDDVCEKNTVILLSDGQPTVSRSDSKNAIRALVGSCANRGSGTCGKELAGYMHDSKGLDVFTVGFALDNDPTAKTYLEEIAQEGGGEFYAASDEEQLIESFNSIIDISTRNSSFSSPSVSASNSPFTNDAYVYLQQFFPSLSPKWPGNVKKYQVQDLALKDKNGTDIYDGNGILRKSTFDFWNDTTTPDGGEISLGGMASRLDTARIDHVYTDDAAGDTMVKLEAANVSASDFHVDTPEFQDILAYTQGVELDASGNITDARRYIGDPLHTRLVPVLYDEGAGVMRTVMFFGTNEGYVHAVELGTGDITGSEGGNELFAFMPRSFLKNQKYFKANSELKVDTNDIDPATGEYVTRDVEHIYGMDGETQIWHFDANADGLINNAEEVYLAMGMRRGGREYYIIDISDPDAPELYMHIKGGEGDFANLGQTWAPLKLTYIQDSSGNPQRAIILSGGYDDKQDNDPVPYDRDDPPSTYDAPRDSVGDDYGNDIFVVGFDGAQKGNVLWHAQQSAPADMKYGITGGVALVDTTGDGMTDRLYAADVGGQLWRVKLDKNLSSSTVARLIDINDGTAAGNRRFYYEPSISFQKIKGRRSFNIALGSGFRAHPLNQAIEERFYLVRDDQGGTSAMEDRDESDLFDASSWAPGDSLSSGNKAKLDVNGWYIDLADNEKSLANPIIYNGNVFFTAYVPPADAGSDPEECSGSALGDGYFYAVAVADAGPPFELVDENHSNLDNRKIKLNSQGIPGDPVIMNGDTGPIIFAGGDVIKDIHGESPLSSDSFRQEFWIDLFD